MLKCLTDQLGVSEASLKALGIGWAPVVTFKNKKTQKETVSYTGWWVIPERNPQGEIEGLSLRSRAGDKFMYPGTSHGLVYALSPYFAVGQSTDNPGFIRTMDAGVDCPVCEKPDGCLVSSEDPEDPQACVCIRVKDGAERPMKFGYLHILKASGHINKNSPLGNGTDPIIVIEGMSDTASAMDLGLVAVGRPSALGGMKDLAELVAGRDVILIGENDKADKYGRKAGLQGLQAAFEILQPKSRSLVRILPPEGVKDFREWRRTYNLDKQTLLAYVAKYGEMTNDSSLLDDKAPLYIARRWLKENHTVDEHITLRKYEGQWFRYATDHYEEIEPDAVIRGGLYRFLEGKTVKIIKEDGSVSVEPYEATRSKVTDVMDAMNISCPIDATPPCWLDGRETPDPRMAIVYQNGILDFNAYVAGDVEALTPATPALFSLSALPYDFDPNATCQTWLDFLQGALGDDPSKIDLLQEWMGYCMTPDMSREKFLMFQGSPGSGKGTTLDMIQGLIGEHQVASTSFRSVGSRFGRAGLVGKLAAIMPDARLPRSADAMAALETLLAIVGRDGVDVDRKNLPELSNHHLSTRFTIAVNELPELPDHNQALQRRMMMIHFATSFVGKEDITLKDRLRHEVSGVAVWALEGLKRLVETNRFTEPESSKTLIREFRNITSPMVEFVEECCVTDETRKIEIDKDELFEAWLAWCKERGLQPSFRSRFTTRLTSTYPTVATASGVVLGKTVSVYTGIDLQPWAQSRLLGKPGD